MLWSLVQAALKNRLVNVFRIQSCPPTFVWFHWVMVSFDESLNHIKLDSLQSFLWGVDKQCKNTYRCLTFMRGSRGGWGFRTPPGKSQVQWNSIENSIWTPSPPPPPRKITVSIEINH